MSRFIIIILVNFVFILQIKIGFCLKNDTCAVCDCSCDVEIDVVKKVMKGLKDVKKSTDKIEQQLTANRATNPSSCMEAAATSLKSGVYKIKLEKLNIADLEVFCDEDVDFGGWLVIQRRQSGSVRFYRCWNDYKKGFGDLTGNYWIGLEKLHALTSSCEQELYIQLQRRSGEKYHAKYAEFLIGPESQSYTLKKLGNYGGNAGDSLRQHLGMKFSTYDRDNDNLENNCAMKYEGAWWFDDCYYSHLNGVYNGDFYGVAWNAIKKEESLSFSQMMIRPTQNCWRRLMLGNLNRYT
ncbi:fibrinogen C domain-containing protein 1-like [Zeugodacus cucurbitae]|uniref:fibrinogen C domain-containing protein 1-like n=1 Tax=Zeugodacus cucurbitae TaxID=28588 RepID=UPI0023D8F971|nr:fibrinogen C domain-containing protein 1-like [Zeugodacus cucurbitae]